MKVTVTAQLDVLMNNDFDYPEISFEYHRACGNLDFKSDRYASLTLLRRYRFANAHPATLRLLQRSTQTGDSTSTLIGAILSQQVGSVNEQSLWL